MGSRGPAPEPTRLKLVKGTATTEDLEEEPIPETAEIKPPAWLTTAARNVWKELAPDLEAQGVLTPWDRHLFARVCALEAINRKAFEDVQKRGNLVKGDKGRMVKNPSLQILRDTQTLLTTLAGRFGLTPSDRAQLKIGDGQKGTRRGAERLLD